MSSPPTAARAATFAAFALILSSSSLLSLCALERFSCFSPSTPALFSA
jgi:hypothetical protein